MQRFFSTNEVATRLGISTTKVREMIANGTLKGCNKVGGEWQIPLEENTEILKKDSIADLFRDKRIAVLGSILVTLITIIGVIISSGADLGGAKKQLEQWGIFPNFASRKDGEVLIVIATFYHSEGVINTEPHNKIDTAIEVAAHELGYDHLRVAVDPQIISESDTQKAIELGFRYDANIVIWGSDTGTEVVVNFLNLKDPFQPLSNVNMSETNNVQLANNPDPYVQFVNFDLPNKLTFLSLFAIGQSYYSERNYQNAIVSIEKAINSVKETPIEGVYLSKAYFRLGWLYEFSGNKDKEKAIDLYGKAIDLDPTHSEGAYNNRGTILADKGLNEQAIDDYTMSIKNQPLNPIPYTNRGTVYYEMGEIELAEKDFDTAVELDPENPSMYWNRAVFRDYENDVFGAIIDYSEVINRRPDDAYAYVSRGVLFAKNGQMEQALLDLNKAIELDENNPYFYIKRAAFHTINGNPKLAREDFNHALKLNPTEEQRIQIEAAIKELEGK